MFSLLRSRKRRRKKDIRTLEEKRVEWTQRWQSPDYDPFWNPKEFPPTIQRLIDERLVPERATVVDIGCGSGYLSHLLSEKGYRVMGLDFARSAIESARARFSEKPGRLEFHTADVTSPLPFAVSCEIGIDRGTFQTLPYENRASYAESVSPLIEKGGALIMIYSRWAAKELKRTRRDDRSEMLRKHLSTVFSPHFLLETLRDTVIESHSREDIPAFLIVLRRR